MNRIDGLNYVADLFGAGKNGFRDGVLAEAIYPTYLNAKWFNAIQEELMTVIEGAGVAPDGVVRTQVLKAIKRLMGGNVTTVNAANSPLALTADNAGLVILDATAGNISATLPEVDAVAGVPLRFNFVRMDATGNTATVNRASTDTFVGGATSFTVVGQGAARSIEGDSATKWATIAGGEAATRKIAQIARYETGAFASGSGTIPLDNTKPQITEGDQYMSLAFTPQNAASELHIRVEVCANLNTSNGLTVALFRDAVANALQVVTGYSVSNGHGPFVFTHKMVPGSTAAITFRVRAGGAGGSTYFNGFSSGGIFDGVFISSLTITEYLP